MTSMLMLKHEDGTFMNFDQDVDPVFEDLDSGYASENKREMEAYRDEFGGHLVELVPAKAKVPVNQ